jgi:hypothetical protein
MSQWATLEASFKKSLATASEIKQDMPVGSEGLFSAAGFCGRRRMRSEVATSCRS